MESSWYDAAHITLTINEPKGFKLRMAETIKCARCSNNRSALGYAPVPTDLGRRIAVEICQPCWAEWLQKQTMLINHYGLDVSNPDTHEFLFDNMQAFFYGGSTATIDTTKQGSVNW